MCFRIVKDYTAFSASYVAPNFCPSATLAANNTFPDPTGPTYFRIVNDIHVLGFLVPVVFYH